MTEPDDPSVKHLLGRLDVVRVAAAEEVERRREHDPGMDDPFRGLYLSAEHVETLMTPAGSQPVLHCGRSEQALALLAEVEEAADQAECAGADIRLRRLERSFGLDSLDVELLLIAMAPDVDARFERLYGFLNDDVSRRRASISLALELAGSCTWSAPGRHRLAAGGPLASAGLLLVEDGDRPTLTRSLRVPDRVVAHLLGNDDADPLLRAMLIEPDAAAAPPLPGLGVALSAGTGLCHLRESAGGTGASRAASALRESGLAVLALDAARLPADVDAATVAAVAARDARLVGAGVVVGPVELLSDSGPAAVRAFADLPATVVMVGTRGWDPEWSERVPLLVDVPELTAGDRRRLWHTHLNGDAPDDLEAAGLAEQLGLRPEQVARAVAAARGQATMLGTPLRVEHLRGGVRAQNAAGLDRLARRVRPQVGWTDLVLPPATLAELRELEVRARYRHVVLSEWAMRPGGGRGRGVIALFAGESGTGKTMSAEVLAAALGLDLYAVNLATVVDKYVGETEKNLDRIFTEAGGVNGVLLFDEADAIFGKRSEVRDAHDRYANMESAYLLQRMESFDGLAVLSTNLRANLDDAFTRRLDAVIDFPTPDEVHRSELWERCLGTRMPRADDLDLDFCARAFELAGGNIRSATLTAAYFAAEAGRPVSMVDLVRAVHREYRKLGRLCLESEFGEYHRLLGGEGDLTVPTVGVGGPA